MPRLYPFVVDIDLTIDRPTYQNQHFLVATITTAQIWEHPKFSNITEVITPNLGRSDRQFSVAAYHDVVGCTSVELPNY
ncbi:hypothetical protein [Chamaesiphon sp.]|uniref:hypothetical protein n=1 Tax=Chamaesiphon sp. TaxID=2814140 RepID=UPI0035941BD7